jgi:hypothetical protein
VEYVEFVKEVSGRNPIPTGDSRRDNDRLMVLTEEYPMVAAFGMAMAHSKVIIRESN